MAKNNPTSIMQKGIRTATALLKRCGFIPVKGHYSQGFHYNSGFFFSPRGTLWYWMTSDDRFFPGATPLFRTAKHLKDFTGGTNRYPKDEEQLKQLVEDVDFDLLRV